MRGQYLVYCLIDPFTNEVYYIGKSSYGLHRPKTHLNPNVYNKNTAPVYGWVRKLAQQGVLPIIEIIEECNTDTECYAAELYYMKLFSREGEPLLNYIKNSTYRGPRKQFNHIHKQFLRMISKKRKPVINLTTGERFVSSRAAAEAYKCDHRGICRTCNGEYKWYKNCQWSWDNN